MEKNAKTHLSPPAEEENLREVLLDLAEDGKIETPPETIKKANAKRIKRIHSNYTRKQAEFVTNQLSAVVVDNYSKALAALSLVESSENLANELSNNELIMADVTRVVTYVASFLPLLGLAAGGVTTLRHVWEKNLYSALKPIPEEEEPVVGQSELPLPTRGQ